jgi:L-ribulose-5-phosphate 3-epimerase
VVADLMAGRGGGPLRLGYNTNGFAHHRLPDALAVIAELGYRAVALTLDVHHLDPFAPGHAAARREVAAACRALDLRPVVETGARFLLDPRGKHRPTLLAAGAAERGRRLDLLWRAIDVAAELATPAWPGVVSLWSGAADPGDAAPREALDDRLAAGLRAVCERARAAGVTVGFEPEPGMHVEDMAGYLRIRALVGHPALRLTLDVGHAHVTEAAGAAATVRAFAADLVNVQVEGMFRARHEHLPPWEGDLDVREVMRTLREVGYRGPACLELSRHSHDAVRIARRALAYLTGA